MTMFILVTSYATALRPHVNSGKLKTLGVTSARATELMSGVQTEREKWTRIIRAAKITLD